MSEQADRQPAYAAVYAYIAALPDSDNAYRNAQIWRAVHLALDAVLPAPDPAAGPTVREAAAQDAAHWTDKYAREQP